MGYMKIPNLYKEQDILIFKRCFAMEKIHGTSAHVGYKDGKVIFFSGGEKYQNFIGLFDESVLLTKFKEISDSRFSGQDIIVYGEAYGGRQQGMSNTYGKQLKFVAFDVKVGEDKWLNVPHAEFIAKELGIEFVFYQEISTDLAEIDKARDLDSQQAIRNGVGPGHIAEGVVLRPLVELRKNDGGRIICKHKRDEFKETKTTKAVVDPEKWKVLENAKEIALEWVTINRLKNILSHLSDVMINVENTSKIINLMIEDIEKESVNELIMSNEVKKEISRKTAIIFKEFIKNEMLNIKV